MLLLISDRTELRQALTRLLASSGLFVFDVPLEVGEFYCRQKDTGGVVLDCIPDRSGASSLCRALRSAYPELPILTITAQEYPTDMPSDCSLSDTDAESLSSRILEFYKTVCGWRETPLSTFSLTVGPTPEEIVYMGYPLVLSKTEHTILRCLLYRSPSITSADDLMSLCYPTGRQNISNLAVQIRRINRRASLIDPRPLIVNVYGKGYRLRDGI